MIKYRVKYLADGDDANPTYYHSEHPLKVGDVIQINSFYHHIREITPLKTINRLSVSQSAQTIEEAIQMPPYPKNKK